MADLREVPPGRPPWIPAPEPWWAWPVRIGLALAALCGVAGNLYLGVLTAIELVREAAR